MIYTTPHYYSRFHCVASECADTCCAGWAIMIDNRSLEEYGNMKGAFGNRLRNSIHWKEGSFKQYHGRCVFLNDENLCDIYGEAGPEHLCRTCRTYPRHIEEFEGAREISLCLSCIEAARIILSCEEPVRFLTREDDREENYEDFDFFLYTKLMDARDLALDLLRDRSVPCSARMSLCLGLAHDLQARIRREQLYETDALLERYRRADRMSYLAQRLERCRISRISRYEVMMDLYGILPEMETLNKGWPEFAALMGENLYGKGREYYERERLSFLKSSIGERLALGREQLTVYFVFTYFCGAVYNGQPYGKMKMAVGAVLLIEELAQALWTEQGGELSFMDYVDVAHRFSREVEHSDRNKAFLEHVLCSRPEFSLNRFLAAVNG